MRDFTAPPLKVLDPYVKGRCGIIIIPGLAVAVTGCGAMSREIVASSSRTAST
jgi:hypothetical protein